MSGAKPKTTKSNAPGTSERQTRRGRVNSTPKVSGSPSVLGNTTSAACPPEVDDELECTLVYGDYLLALMKRQIVSNTITKHEQALKDQLAVSKDDLHKSKEMLKKKQQEVQGLLSLKDAGDLLKIAETNIEAFSQLQVVNDFEDTISQLLAVLDMFTKKVHVKNIKPICDQDSFDRLQLIAVECIAVIEKIKASQPIDSINKLAILMKQFQEVSDSVAKKQLFMRDLHRNGTFNLLKRISDMYAKKEKYGPEASGVGASCSVPSTSHSPQSSQ